MEREEILINIDNQFFQKLLLFLDHLRISGYNIGLDQYLNIQRVIVTLAANGMLPLSTIQLEKKIAPIVCNSSIEQKKFSYQFNNWIKQYCFKEEDKKQLTEFSQHPQEEFQKKQTEKVQNEIKQTRKKFILRLSSITLLTLFLVGIVGIGLLYLDTYNDQTTTTYQSPLTSSKLENNSHTISTDNFLQDYVSNYSYQKFLLLILIISSLALLFFILRKLWQYQPTMYLSQRKANRLSKIENFFVKNIDHQMFQSFSLLRTAQKLRTHQQIRSKDIDIHNTVKKSIEKGGLFTPVYQFRRVLPEYLILIDRNTYNDHYSRYVDSFIEKIASYDVSIKTYYFDGDPRSCQSDTEKDTLLNIVDLASMYNDYRLIVFTHSNTFINAFTGELVEWIDQFDAWENKAILSLEPIEIFQTNLHQLIDTDFYILPAKEAGLSQFIDNILQHNKISNRHEDNENNSIINPLTDIFENNPKRFCERKALETEKIEVLIELLKEYLGRETFYWLCACAVYPELNWNLTLYIGYNLKLDNKPVFSESFLSLLADLPWFRYGRIPDWLRQRLIDEMSIAQEKYVRQLIDILFITALEKPVNSFKLSYAKDTRKVSKLSSKIQNILRKQSSHFSNENDQIFCSFMYSKLAVRIPQKVLSYFKQQHYLNKRTKYEVFKPVESFDKAKIILAIIFGMLCCYRIDIINESTIKSCINLHPLQIVIVFFVGYYYGKLIGLISGFFVFFPNLFIFISAYSEALAESSFIFFWSDIKSFLYLGANRYDFIFIERMDYFYIDFNNNLQKALLIAWITSYYVLNGLVGFLSAFLKQKLHNYQKNHEIFDSKKYTISRKRKYYFIIIFSTYLLCFHYYLPISSKYIIHIQPYSVMPFIFLTISLYYGIRSALKIFLFCLPTCIIFYNIQFNYNIQSNHSYLVVGGFYQHTYLLLILFSIVIAGYLNVNFTLQIHKGNYSKILFLSMLLTLIVFSFSSINSDYSTSSMSCITLFILSLAGIIFGSRKGFWMGLYGLALFISFEMVLPTTATSSIIFLAFDPFMQMYPLLAFIAGANFFQGKIFRRFLILYLGLTLCCSYLILINMPFSFQKYFSNSIAICLSYLLLIISYPFFCWLRPGYLKDEYDNIFQRPLMRKYVIFLLLILLSIFSIHIKLENFSLLLTMVPVQTLILFYIAFFFGKPYAFYSGIFFLMLGTQFGHLRYSFEDMYNHTIYTYNNSLKVIFFYMGNSIISAVSPYIFANLKATIVKNYEKSYLLIRKQLPTYKTFWFFFPFFIYLFIIIAIDYFDKTYWGELNKDFFLSFFRFEILPVISLFLYVFYYGFDNVFKIIIVYGFLVLFQTQINIDTVYILVSNHIWLFTALIIIGYLNPSYGKRYEKKSIVLFLLFTLSLLTAFVFKPPNVFPITGLGLSVSIIVISGYLLGPLQGFWFGLLWSICGLFTFHFSYGGLNDLSFLFIHGPFAYISPIIGYYGGLLTKTTFLKTTFKYNIFIHLFIIIYYTSWLLTGINTLPFVAMYISSFLLATCGLLLFRFTRLFSTSR